MPKRNQVSRQSSAESSITSSEDSTTEHFSTNTKIGVGVVVLLAIIALIFFARQNKWWPFASVSSVAGAVTAPVAK